MSLASDQRNRNVTLLTVQLTCFYLLTSRSDGHRGKGDGVVVCVSGSVLKDKVDSESLLTHDQDVGGVEQKSSRLVIALDLRLSHCPSI